MISAIWSGGQTGVDQGALEAAKRCGVATGGWMPRGWLTEDGPRPDFAERYGLRENDSASYAARTRRNAAETDGTVWIEGPGDIAEDRGYVTTSKAVTAHGKPFLRIALELGTGAAAAMICQWAHDNQVSRLNVAGPRGSRWPEGHDRARSIVEAILMHRGDAGAPSEIAAKVSRG